ncbi:response regulator transcription factor [Gracilibacillus thailandensis]|uniref:Helix-turn-helix domain-containing protein n=1 Tax=Gracilibacillus thailandensis TaxID=563735 RepID=A0A6N7QX02_9BACI|nr:helix-turn-helix domain-containing protein [Gracilibacillus thailandensis]MRI66643.1 helix-turn-helix domain-containing protein [Gracilibacillus thailandensis]
MYRLLIVDDEELITDGLYDVFSRLMPEHLDVYKAYSGKEALDWMSRTRIDIILTDISMPGLSGLELIERVQSLWPHCRVIFLTGYDYFDYVYQAIQMNDVKYLLKTEGYAKVVETVKEILMELKQSSLKSQLPELTDQEKHAYEMMAQSDFMRHLIQKSNVSVRDFSNLEVEFHHLNIPLKTSEQVYLVLGNLTYPKNTTYTKQTNILHYVRSYWEQKFSSQLKSLSIMDRYGDLVWFIQMKEDKPFTPQHLLDYLEGNLEMIQDDCLQIMDLTLQFTMSNGPVDWQSVSEKYEYLRQLQQLKLDSKYPSIIKEQPNQAETVETLNPIPKMDLLTAHLSANRREEFFEEFYELIKSVQKDSYHQMTKVYYSVALVLYVDISQNQLQNRMDDLDKTFKIDEHTSLTSSFNYLEKVANQLFALKKADGQDRASQVIEGICQYIENHLDEDLSLVRLAEIHYFNPSYLSYFFKQEQGINLSEYIDRCRIRKARELLSHSDLKVREVSEKVGYHTAHSFTRFFKKMTGMTPKEYRGSLSKQ